MPTSKPTAKIVPHLWFADQAVEAATFYASLFGDSRRSPRRPGIGLAPVSP
jgi:predicted 3-demethylubiquinone-9 3-methyltransferase (glyoxalase superfamily)